MTSRCWQTGGMPDFAVHSEPCVLLKLGEIVLKGRNRTQFDHMLQGNIRAAVREIGVPVDLRQRDGVILLRVADGASRGEQGWAKAAADGAEKAPRKAPARKAPAENAAAKDGAARDGAAKQGVAKTAAAKPATAKKAATKKKAGAKAPAKIPRRAAE